MPNPREPQTSQDTIVISQLAAISPLGIGYHAFAQGLSSGCPRLGPLALFTLPVPGGEVWDFAPEALLGRKGLRTLDRNTLLVLSCIQHDLAAAIDAIGADRVGLALGTTFGSFSSMSDFAKTYLSEGFRALNPGLFPNLVINAPPSQGNIRFGLTASSTTLANGATSGIDTLLYGAMRLQRGDEDALICGASEELSEVLCQAAAHQGHWSSTGSLRPMAPTRDGTLPGEGAAMVLLESQSSALSRGASPLTVLEASATCHGPAAPGEQLGPSSDAGAWVLRETLRRAGVSLQELDFVAISANGSLAKDAAEQRALLQVLGQHQPAIPLIAYAVYIGDTAAASSAFQLIAAITDLQRDCLAGTPHAPAPETIAPLWMPQEPLPRPLQRCMVLSLGETGGATALLLRKDNGGP